MSTNTQDGEFLIIHDETEKTFEDPTQFEGTVAILEDNDTDFEVSVPEWYDGNVDAEIIDHTTDGGSKEENGHKESDTQAQETTVIADAPDHPTENRPSSSAEMLEQAVVDWFGGKNSPFISEIDHGRNTSFDLNKDGTQLVTTILDLEMDRDCEVHAHETEFQYCRYRATATRPDGKSFTAVGDAHIDESGKDKWDLERLAETRAKKRAVKWATAGGVEALRQAGDKDE